MLSWNLKVGKYCSTTENVKINNHKVFRFWRIENKTIFLKMDRIKIQRTMEIEKKGIQGIVQIWVKWVRSSSSSRSLSATWSTFDCKGCPNIPYLQFLDALAFLDFKLSVSQ